jgi:outer membrane protein assembly factor BamB
MKVARFSLLIVFGLIVLSSAGCVGAPPPQGFAGITTDGESLFVGSADGKILALDVAARATNSPYPSSTEWSYEITTERKGSFGCGTSQTPSILYGTPVLTDGHLCIGTYDGKVLMMSSEARSLNLVFPQTREGEWMYPRTDDKIGAVVGRPAIEGDRVFISSSVKDGSHTLGVVYALDRLFGDELWVSEPLDGKLWVTPVVVDGVVYISTFDGRIYSLDAASGKVLPWVFQNEFGFVSSPMSGEGMLYVGSFDRSLYAIPVGSDAPAWKYQGGNWFWGTPLLSNGILYAPCLDGKLYALKADSGAPLWGVPYDAADPIAATPVLVDDKVVVVTKKGDVHVIDAATGLGARVPNPTNEKATTCNAQVIASPCYYQGLVYVRAQNNVLYAIDPVLKNIAFTFSLKTE